MKYRLLSWVNSSALEIVLLSAVTDANFSAFAMPSMDERRLFSIVRSWRLLSSPIPSKDPISLLFRFKYSTPWRPLNSENDVRPQSSRYTIFTSLSALKLDNPLFPERWSSIVSLLLKPDRSLKLFPPAIIVLALMLLRIEMSVKPLSPTYKYETGLSNERSVIPLFPDRLISFINSWSVLKPARLLILLFATDKK